MNRYEKVFLIPIMPDGSNIHRSLIHYRLKPVITVKTIKSRIHLFSPLLKASYLPLPYLPKDY